jgi:hypothetical protein
VIAFWFAPLIGFCQNELLNDLLSSSSTGAIEGRQKITEHINNLRSRETKKEIALLHKIFWSTQKRFLKTYSPYETFGELFVSGKYDCLTATSLYSLLLSEFNFDFNIIETNYHIFIVVHTSSGEVLIETTDRYNGFVQDKKEIQSRIGTYKENLIAATDPNSTYYTYSFDLYKKISPFQLTGLLHFNRAVNAFNQHEWLACANELALSESKYESPRVKELAALLVQSVITSDDANEEVKGAVLKRFKSYWLEKQPTVANN